MMKIALDQLEILDAIDRRGSFAAAAEELHRVPSAVTYSIRQLEDRLGASLFDRSGHRARLTEVGRLLLDDGRRLLEAADQLERRVKHVATGWEPEFRIVLSDLIPARWLWPLLAEFQAECAYTRVYLRRETFGGAWEALVDDRADLVIGVAAEAVGTGPYRTRPWLDVDWAFCVAPGHPLAAGQEPLERAAVEAHCVVAAEDSSRRLAPRRAGIVSGQQVLNVPDMQSKLEAQLAGVGVGFLPRFLILDALADGRLLEKVVAEPRHQTSLQLAWRRGTGRALADGKALQWWLARLDGWNPLMPRK